MIGNTSIAMQSSKNLRTILPSIKISIPSIWKIVHFSVSFQINLPSMLYAFVMFVYIPSNNNSYVAEAFLYIHISHVFRWMCELNGFTAFEHRLRYILTEFGLRKKILPSCNKLCFLTFNRGTACYLLRIALMWLLFFFASCFASLQQIKFVLFFILF